MYCWLLLLFFFFFFTDFALIKLKGFFNNEGRQLCDWSVLHWLQHDKFGEKGLVKVIVGVRLYVDALILGFFHLGFGFVLYPWGFLLSSPTVLPTHHGVLWREMHKGEPIHLGKSGLHIQ